MTPRWLIREAQADDAPAWIEMRTRLWPDESAGLLAHDANAYFGSRGRAVALLAFAGGTEAVGFAEATIRTDYVNGTDSSPVGFLEGWYVAPGWRTRGIGRALVAAVEKWTRDQGCVELASDTWLDHVDSQRAHVACGFEETERIVYFRKRLSAAG